MAKKKKQKKAAEGQRQTIELFGGGQERLLRLATLQARGRMGFGAIDRMREDTGKVLMGTGFVKKSDIDKIINEANEPITRAFLGELVQLMHRYGFYFNPRSPVWTAENLPDGAEIGFEGEEIVFDTDGDLGKAGRALVAINKPTAHQKMEQTALRLSLLPTASTEGDEA